MKSERSLGMIDWGIGAVGIYKLIRSRLGYVGITYLADTGAMPYGRMSRPALVSRMNDVVRFLRSQGVTHLVVGCNAASTVIPLLDLAGLKVEGVIDNAVRYAARMHPPRLALIGGRRTVLSGVYRRAFAERGIEVAQRIAQPLSALIESGDVSSRKLHEECQTILAPVRDCSHLLLACTHYPAIAPVLRQFISEDTVLLDPAAEVVNSISRWRLPTGNTDIFLTTGDAASLKSAAKAAFGVSIHTVRPIVI
jgi:glutamate racemase